MLLTLLLNVPKYAYIVSLPSFLDLILYRESLSRSGTCLLFQSAEAEDVRVLVLFFFFFSYGLGVSTHRAIILGPASEMAQLVKVLAVQTS